MKTNTKIIIYDDTCPLCAAYTNAFVQTGLLERKGRQNFNSIQPELLALIDIKKGVNEIPMIDYETGEVLYGIDALLEILSQKMPMIKRIGNTMPVKWFLYKFYKLISYNRRVIVANQQPATGFDCTPEFNTRYRILFMSLFLVFNTLMLFPLHHSVLTISLFNSTSILQLQAAHFTLVTFNIILAIQLGKKHGIEYLGQVNMLALLTILLTVPLIMVNKYFHFQSALINDIYLLSLTVFIIKEYVRRMRFACIMQEHSRIVFINSISIAGLLLYLFFNQ